MLNLIRLGIIQTRKKIKDREPNVRAQEIGPCPDLGDLFGIYDTHDEAFDVLYAWFDEVWALPKPKCEAMLRRAEDNLTCDEPGHDYTDHLSDLISGSNVLSTGAGGLFDGSEHALEVRP